MVAQAKTELPKKNEELKKLAESIEQKDRQITELQQRLKEVEAENESFLQIIEASLEEQDKAKEEEEEEDNEEEKQDEEPGLREAVSESNIAIVEHEAERSNLEEMIINKTCKDMVNVMLQSEIFSVTLRNGVDFLLVNEDRKITRLQNAKLNEYKFGVYLLGEANVLTVDPDKDAHGDILGHLKIKASHLWIKHPKSTIDCSELGYPSDRGRGAGEQFTGTDHSKSYFGGGGGYGSRGGNDDLPLGNGRGGGIYGEQTLFTHIRCGSGGGSGSYRGRILRGGRGGGIIELIIDQHFINHGTIKCCGAFGEHIWDGGGGGGSGGSILIQVLSPANKLQNVIGAVSCNGGNQGYRNEGGSGRIAIYNITLSTEDLALIDPAPFNLT
ncbi:hypothetical protein RFI_17251 [Reticulomyxa filosa]|uniref:Uncharacterized protein n=1 Tax=Reticulomyxa filosa TaxID=46433 RepID=X6N249_RETFI|nr:hypothetical protein RFI_17251 [Reticulomyxa filosa]|eukprot:ETO19968.1 hypothetical protein RFI_17251 [Reticulomyxa filosa]